ncbi:hypothetical protein GDO78_008259 [Eleutherodactylus coqui]|uniref:DNA replication factor Dna2 N-terminal domain-containing protein n=1 Tax=Eleutherodactylus coqui TaxID=57060 RepID=A0A8J6FBL5_ELECQ|nr:hypothetical protein GDO78_008259 [Eleutherodactylus coqui]
MEIPGDEGVVPSEEELLEMMMESSFTDEKPPDRPPKKIIPRSKLCRGLYNRYCVVEVTEVYAPREEKHLTITAQQDGGDTELCILKDDWVGFQVKAGDIIHLEGNMTLPNTWTVDRDSGYIILFPDLLISGTSIANGIRCLRRSVLGEKFKAATRARLWPERRETPPDLRHWCCAAAAGVAVHLPLRSFQDLRPLLACDILHPAASGPSTAACLRPLTSRPGPDPENCEPPVPISARTTSCGVPTGAAIC